MAETVRILVLESKTTDYDLIRKSLPDYKLEQAKTRKDLLTALQSFQPDIILADYNYPRFNGLKTLQLVEEHAPLVPVIILMDTGDEEIAVACMKAGANNYILKENIKRLEPAIIHALDERQLLLERKQTEDALISNEKRFRALIENGRDNISLLAADGTLLWESPAVDHTLGYAHDEFQGRNIFELIHPEDQGWVQELFGKLILEPGNHQHGTFRLQHADGAWRWVEATASNLLEEPSVNAIVVNYRDITESKRIDDTLKHREAIMSVVASSTQQLIRAENWEEVVPNILAKLGRATDVNRVYIFQNHISPDGVLLTNQHHEWVSLETEPQIDNDNLQNVPMLDAGFSRWVDILENDNVVYGNVQDFPKNEQEFLVPQGIVSLAVVPIFAGEQWWGFIGFDECNSLRTWEKSELYALKTAAGNLGSAIQRQGIQTTLRESEDRYRDLIENSQHLVCTHDLDGNILSANTWAGNVLGYPVDELLKMNLKDLLAPASLERFETYIEVIERKGTAHGQIIVRTRTGDERLWEYNNSLRTTGVEQPIVRGIARDITEQRQAEEALQKSQARYQGLFDISPVLLWEEDYSQVKSFFDHLRSSGVTDFQDYFDNHPQAVKECVDRVQVLDVNRASLEFMGIEDKSEILGSLSKSLNEEGIPNFKAQLVSLANGNTSYQSDEVNTGKDGNKKHIFFSLSVYPEYADSLGKVVVSIMDITERKQAEAALQESEARFAGIVNSAMDGIISVNSDQRIVLFNKSAEKIFGCTAAEAIGQSLERFMPERFRDSHNGHIINFAQTGATTRAMGNLNAIYGLRADGTEFPIEATISRITAGNEHLYTVILRDITERKLANDALRASEERFRLLFDRMMDGVYRSTHEGKFVDINPAMVKMFGYESEEEMLQVDIKNDLYFAPDERGSHLLDTGQDETDTYRMRRKDGSEIWVEDHGTYVHDEQGNVIFHEGILRDVTARKKADEILSQNEMLLHESQKIAGLGHYNFNLSTSHWERSETLNKVLGIDGDYTTDITGWKNLIHASQREEMLAYLTDHVLRDLNPFDREYLIVRLNDGQERWVHGLGRLSFDKNGNPTRMIGTIQDITERKQVEAELSRHLTEMEALYETGLAVSRLLQPDEIGQQVIKTFAKHLSWHHVAIRLKKNEDDLILIALNKPGISETEKGEMERHFSSMVRKVGQGLSGLVVQTGQPLRTGDVHSHPQYIDTQAGVQSGLYMPLKIGARVMGVISVESERVDAFSAQDERLLATLANQAAVALENARLYQAAQLEIDERKRAENALRNSETHYRDLADSITDVMYELDQNLRFTHWNKSAELLTGIPAVSALGKSLSAIFGDTREQMEIERTYLEVLSNRRPKSFETFLNVGGAERVYEINAYPSTSGVSVVAKDVTERKLTEMVMVKRFELMNYSENNLLEDVIQKMLDDITELIPSPLGFFHFVVEDQIASDSQMWFTKTMELSNVLVSEDHHRALEQVGVWEDAVRERLPVVQNNYASLSDKKGMPHDRPVDLIRELVIPIIRNERIVAVMGIGNKQTDYTPQDVETAVHFADHAWDIVQRKQMELTLAEERNQLTIRVEERTADLSRANSNLARALRVKDEFLANMSHELRTPLNAVLGLSESLGEQTAGPLNEKQLKYINTISESGHHLLSLINDILDLAKIDAGQITLNINKVDIKLVCEAGLRMVKQLALKKGQDVALEIDDNIGLMWADERRLKQMLVNLLSNAVKFTPEDGKLGIEVRGDQNANQVSFAIWDNGIGVKENDLPLLFQPFIQLDGGLDREESGTGLGLALVAQMARLHGGGVTAESILDQGSRFIITLPWEPTLTQIDTEKVKNTGKLPLLPTEKNRKYTLLLIEDTQEVTMMLKDYLESAGYQVVTAQDGLEGIDQAMLTHPDLILMDIQMPRVNGFEATKRLRADPKFEHTPIIALTALAMPNDRQRCLDAGMNEYISKPVNLKRLQKIIQGFLLNTEETVKSQ